MDFHAHPQNGIVQLKGIYNNHPVQLPGYSRTAGQGQPQQRQTSPASSSDPLHQLTTVFTLTYNICAKDSHGLSFQYSLGIGEHLKATVHNTLADGQDKHNHAETGALRASQGPQAALMDSRRSHLHHKVFLSHKLFSQSNCTKSFSPCESPCYQSDDFLSL